MNFPGIACYRLEPGILVVAQSRHASIWHEPASGVWRFDIFTAGQRHWVSHVEFCGLDIAGALTSLALATREQPKLKRGLDEMQEHIVACWPAGFR